MSRQGEIRGRTVENVKDFWNNEAKEWGDDPCVTIRDHYFRMLGIHVISEAIKGRSNALDIGCGSGFASLFYSEAVPDFLAADFAESMIECAGRFLESDQYFNSVMRQYSVDPPPKYSDELRFEVGNILDLGYPDATFDAVIAERVLINLPTRELQYQAVREVSRVMRPLGLWCLMEATLQGHEVVDAIREKFGLSILEKYWHNLYVDEAALLSSLGQVGLRLKEVVRLETYQFLTKVVHPALVAPKEPRFLDGFNHAAMIIGREYPDYSAVCALGVENFFTEVFRAEIEAHSPEKLSAYDEVVKKVLGENIGFGDCTHQVLYLIERAETAC